MTGELLEEFLLSLKSCFPACMAVSIDNPIYILSGQQVLTDPKNLNIFFLLILAVLSVCSNSVFAQCADDSVVETVSKREVIHSRILKEDRPILIHLPQNYQSSENRYPVLLILDADQECHFQRSVELVESFADHKDLPRMIIVGIENTNRLRDMNAPTFEYNGKSIVGGADKFLKFIEEEVVTSIDEDYRTSKLRILFGRSASATFSIFAMVSRPDVFNAYIASSPSFYVNNELIAMKTQKFFEKKKSFDRIFFMNLGTEDSMNRVEQTRQYAALLREIAPSDFKWELRIMNGEGHVPVTSMEDGLQMIYGNIKE
jgi:predicted alpha/beta superfamily hydrolase